MQVKHTTSVVKKCVKSTGKPSGSRPSKLSIQNYQIILKHVKYPLYKIFPKIWNFLMFPGYFEISDRSVPKFIKHVVNTQLIPRKYRFSENQ